MYLLKVLNTTRIVKKTKINDSRLVRQISGGILDKFWRTDMKDKPLYPLLYPSLHHRTKGTVYGISSYPPLIECLFRFTTIPFKPFAQQNDKDLCVFLLDNLQLWLAALRNRNKEIFENSTRFFNFACIPFNSLVYLCTYISLDDLNIMVQQYAWEFELCCHLCKQYINQNSTQIFLSWKLRIWKLSVTYNKYR